MKITDYQGMPLVKAEKKRTAPNKGKGLKEEIRLAAEKYGVNQASVTSRIYKARWKGVNLSPDQAAQMVRPGKRGRPKKSDQIHYGKFLTHPEQVDYNEK